jgi:hypothetical protein
MNRSEFQAKANKLLQRLTDFNTLGKTKAEHGAAVLEATSSFHDLEEAAKQRADFRSTIQQSGQVKSFIAQTRRELRDANPARVAAIVAHLEQILEPLEVQYGPLLPSKGR